ncbi:hypothetical protein FALB51S_01284 [Frigidibacter albus]
MTNALSRPCPPTVAAVVVTSNRLAHLRVTLARLLAEPLERICIVDNSTCPQDGTAAWLAAQTDPRLTVLSPPRNLGGAGGFALGLAELERTDPDWIVVMDDDSRPAPGAIARFRAAPPPGWDAVAAAVYDPAGGIAEMNRPARNPFASPGRFVAALLGGAKGLPPDRCRLYRANPCRNRHRLLCRAVPVAAGAATRRPARLAAVHLWRRCAALAAHAGPRAVDRLRPPHPVRT